MMNYVSLSLHTPHPLVLSVSRSQKVQATNHAALQRSVSVGYICREVSSHSMFFPVHTTTHTCMQYFSHFITQANRCHCHQRLLPRGRLKLQVTVLFIHPLLHPPSIQKSAITLQILFLFLSLCLFPTPWHPQYFCSTIFSNKSCTYFLRVDYLSFPCDVCKMKISICKNQLIATTLLSRFHSSLKSVLPTACQQPSTQIWVLSSLPPSM